LRSPSPVELTVDCVLTTTTWLAEVVRPLLSVTFKVTVY